MISLDSVDNGAHNPVDLGKKFVGTIVYGAKDANSPLKAFYIKNISANGNMYIIEEYNKISHEVSITRFQLELEKPPLGLINGDARVWRVSYFPERQWKRGWCNENTIVENINGDQMPPTKISLDTATKMFTPVYSSFEQAVTDVMTFKRKHLAINQSISVMRGKNRLLLLRNFIPFLSIHPGMFMEISPANVGLKKECDYYAALFRSSFGRGKDLFRNARHNSGDGEKPRVA